MKAFFVDLTRCTACRGCQVACKQWKDLPGEDTYNWGSHQNPKSLTGYTYKLVHFKEIPLQDRKVDWVFFSEQCRHCVEPPCYYTADMEIEGSVLRDEETGAVLFTELTKELDFDMIRESCPYDIPRKREDNLITKCNLCNDRVTAGKLPACASACPTGAIIFGDEEEIYELAHKRLKEVLPKYPNAELGDPDSVRVIYLFPYPALEIFDKAIAEVKPVNPLSRRSFLAGKVSRKANQA